MNPNLVHAYADLFSESLAELSLAIAALPPWTPPDGDPRTDLFRTTLAPKATLTWNELRMGLELVWGNPESVVSTDIKAGAGGVDLVRQLWVRVGTKNLGNLTTPDRTKAMQWLVAITLETKKMREEELRRVAEKLELEPLDPPLATSGHLLQFELAQQQQQQARIDSQPPKDEAGDDLQLEDFPSFAHLALSDIIPEVTSESQPRGDAFRAQTPEAQSPSQRRPSTSHGRHQFVVESWIPSNAPSPSILNFEKRSPTFESRAPPAALAAPSSPLLAPTPPNPTLFNYRGADDPPVILSFGSTPLNAPSPSPSSSTSLFVRRRPSAPTASPAAAPPPPEIEQPGSAPNSLPLELAPVTPNPAAPPAAPVVLTAPPKPTFAPAQKNPPPAPHPALSKPSPFSKALPPAARRKVPPPTPTAGPANVPQRRKSVNTPVVAKSAMRSQVKHASTSRPRAAQKPAPVRAAGRTSSSVGSPSAPGRYKVGQAVMVDWDPYGPWPAIVLDIDESEGKWWYNEIDGYQEDDSYLVKSLELGGDWTFFPPTALTPLVAASTLAPRVWKNGAVPVKDDIGLFKAGLALAHDPVRLARWLRRDTVAEQELKEKWLTNQGKAKKRKISWEEEAREYDEIDRREAERKKLDRKRRRGDAA